MDLRPDRLTIETRECLLPGTVLSAALVMEGRALPLRLAVTECLVTDKDRLGYVYRLRFSLETLPEADRQIIGLFISKGRGAPRLQRA